MAPILALPAGNVKETEVRLRYRPSELSKRLWVTRLLPAWD